MAATFQDDVIALARDTGCRTAEDLFTPTAKRITARLLADFLAKHKITVTELMHRADMIDRAEGTGTLLQHAVQKIAVVRAAHEQRPVQEIIRDIHKLVAALSQKVHREKKQELFPDMPAAGFAPLAAGLAARADGTYILNGTITRYLRDVKIWNEKALRLLALVNKAPPNLLNAVDAMLGEMLRVPSAIEDVLGRKNMLGDTVIALLYLYLGVSEDGPYVGEQTPKLLAKAFAANLLPETRAAVGAQIAAQLDGQTRLNTVSYDAELRAMKQITQLAQRAFAAGLPRDEVMAHLELRSKRLTTSEVISAGLANTVLPAEKVEWLLFAQDCLEGERNKQVLANFAVRIATADSFKTQFLLSGVPLTKRLQKLTALNAAALQSGFHENDRTKLAAAFDNLAFHLANDARLFESIDAKLANPVEKVLALLKLHEAASFTEGRLSQKLRDTVIGYMATPGFLASYVQRVSADPAGADLTQRMQKIGLSAADIRELLAA